MFEAIGRLAPGVTLDQARARVAASAARQTRDHPEMSRTPSATLVPLRDRLLAPTWRAALVLVLGAVTFVLLLCCVTVAHLLVARALDRRRDLAIRLALGGTRFRAVRETIAESVLLVLLSSGIGLLVAGWLVPLASALGAGRVPALAGTVVGRETVAFVGVIAVVAATLLTLVSAITVANVPADMLPRLSRTPAAGGGRGVRLVLVAAEVALSIVLLVGAALMVRSLERLRRVDPGFASDHLLTLRLRMPPGRYRTAQSAAAFGDRLTTESRTSCRRPSPRRCRPARAACIFSARSSRTNFRILPPRTTRSPIGRS